MNYTEDRPWGSFTILEETNTYKVKRIVVKPGQRLSYQYHFKREENWVVVAGKAKITINENSQVYERGQSIFIPIEARHRIANDGNENVVFIEVQTGTYFGEDDIVRVQDDYSRT
jgi:mannose-6-phosphate isomerase